MKEESEKNQGIQERTFSFALQIIQFCSILEHSGGVTRTLGQQILRSGTSIGANIEEGQGGQSKADFISKYSIARKEARETRYWLRLLIASKLVPTMPAAKLLQETEETIKILTTIILKSKQNL